MTPILQFIGNVTALQGSGVTEFANAYKMREAGRPDAAFRLYESVRIPRSARVVWSTREMGRIYHAQG